MLGNFIGEEAGLPKVAANSAVMRCGWTGVGSMREMEMTDIDGAAKREDRVGFRGVSYVRLDATHLKERYDGRPESGR
ncbi:MAG: hypothetical protein JWN66_2597 [Sphingomonas bacterium]|nr:hypothetical protein [Sphingomonas bacterium]